MNLAKKQLLLQQCKLHMLRSTWSKHLQKKALFKREKRCKEITEGVLTLIGNKVKRKIIFKGKKLWLELQFIRPILLLTLRDSLPRYK